MQILEVFNALVCGLFLSIEQEKWTPSNANLLRAEMIGWLNFESSAKKFYMDVVGEDGRVMACSMLFYAI